MLEPKSKEILRNIVTCSDVDKVEHAVGMGCNAWDMVDPKEIIRASWKLKDDENLEWEECCDVLFSALDGLKDRYRISLLTICGTFSESEKKELEDLEKRAPSRIQNILNFENAIKHYKRLKDRK